VSREGIEPTLESTTSTHGYAQKPHRLSSRERVDRNGRDWTTTATT
jgi:hypothetical protein